MSWARRVGRRRLWALEDCRHVTRGLEWTLQRHRQRLVRVPPRLTAPERRRGRVRGKSDLIDALAIARAALREPVLDSPRPEEARLRELKLLVDHRDDLVDERRRAQQRLRWHLHELDPTCWCRSARSTAMSGLTGSSVSSPAASRRPGADRARATHPLPQPHPRDRSARPRPPRPDKPLAPRLLELPGCGGITAAKLLCEIGPIDRFRGDAQLARHAGVAPLDASSGKHQRHRLDRGGNRQLNCALHRIAITQGRVHPPARAYLERKQPEGKSRREALRCLKRQLARTVYTILKSKPLLT